MLLVLAGNLAACSKAPTLTALDPPDGRPHDVVLVQGDERQWAQIVWDAGTTTETVIPGGFLGAFMFSVPDGAPAGAHSVALQNAAGRSTSVTFNVPMTPGPLDVPRPPGPTVPFPAPRIDAVTLVGAAFEPSGVRTTLYVQGANLDVGATIWVQDSKTAPLVEIPTVSHRVLRNEWYGVSHDDLSYPIYHYSSTIASAGLRPAGQRIWIVAQNLGGQPSEPFEYKLPSDAATLDSDGDNLPDSWETSGYDANSDGVIDVNLPALGANPYRRDLFLELDIMDNVLYRPDKDAAGKADSTTLDGLKQMFESAPILNIGNAQGIHLVIDSLEKPCLPKPGGGELCTFSTVMFDIGGQIPMRVEPDPFTTGIVRFSRLKAHSFDDAGRGKIYHYAIWGRDEISGHSGVSDRADDFLISFDGMAFPPTYHTPRSNIEILAHEFGHNLRQIHAGGDDFPERKPNFLGVMTYSWLFRTGWSNARRLERATCLPFYYAASDAKEGVNGEVPSDVNTIVDYSEGMARPLIRPLPSTSGTSSICGSTIDWTDIDSAYNTLEDFPNWRHLVFEGPVKNGGIP